MPGSATDRMSAPPTIPAAAAAGRWARVFGTLKFRVVLVVVAAALASGGATTWYLSRESERVATLMFSQQQSDEVELLADMLGGKIMQIQNNLRLLAGEVTPELLAEPAAVEALLLARPAARQLFEAIFVTTLEGERRSGLVLQQAQRFPLNVRDRDYFASTLATRQPVVSEPLASRVTGNTILFFTMPLKSAHGDLFGMMAATVALDSSDLLPPTLSMVGQFDSTLVVYSQEGTILSHPDRNRILRNVGDEPGLGPVHAEWVKDGRTLFSEGLARLVPGYTVSIAGVPAARWMVGRITAEHSALGQLRAAQGRSWGVTAAIMGISALLAALLIVWMTQPITRLRDRARLLLGGDTPSESGWPRAGGEVGELVEAVRQVTIERARARATERLMVDQLRAILQHASIGIILTRDQRFELVGRHLLEMLGYTEEEMLGQPARMIYPSDEAYAELGRRVDEQMQAQSRFDGDVQFRRKDGSLIWAHMIGRGLVPGNSAAGTIWIMHDVTAAREATRQLSWSATHDALTRLVNRHEFEARLARAMEQFESSGICAMFVDLDHFKAINDTAGHAAGDDALRAVAQVLESRVRQSDTVGRIGGDEFAILLAGCSLPQAREIAEQVRRAVEAMELRHRGRRFEISASIGIVDVTPALRSVAEVLHAADTACYEAKRNGRNRVVEYEPAMAATAAPSLWQDM